MEEVFLVFVLRLNNMREAKCEVLTAVCRAESREALEAYVRSEMAESQYVDGHWHKTFKAGGPLEWYNPPAMHWEVADDFFVDAGTEDDWANRARREYQERVMLLFHVSGMIRVEDAPVTERALP